MRVFISSTFYDLVDLRSELLEFFQGAGVETVLSDEACSHFRQAPDRHSIETCLSNVRACDYFLKYDTWLDEALSFAGGV